MGGGRCPHLFSEPHARYCTLKGRRGCRCYRMSWGADATAQEGAAPCSTALRREKGCSSGHRARAHPTVQGAAQMPLRKRGADATQRVQMLLRGCDATAQEGRRCYCAEGADATHIGADATARSWGAEGVGASALNPKPLTLNPMLLIWAPMLLHARGARRVWVHPRVCLIAGFGRPNRFALNLNPKP